MKNIRIIIILAILYLFSFNARTQQSDTTYQLYMNNIDKGLYYLQDNQYEDAINSFWEAIYIIPEKPEAYINIASVYLERPDPETAMRFLIRAKNTMPAGYIKESILFYNLGLCSYMLGDYHSAIDYYSQALRVKSDFGEAAYGLGLCYIKINQPEKAFNSFTKAKSVFTLYEQLDFVRKTDDMLMTLNKDYGLPQEPIKTAAEVTESIPGDAQSYYKKGIEYAQQENYPQAIEHFRQALKINPAFAKAYINLGSTYGVMKKYKEALSEYKKAAKYDKNNPKIYYNIAMVYVAIGNEAKARQYLEKAKYLCVGYDDRDLLNKINEWL